MSQELDQQNPVEEPVHTQDQVSTTDPDSTYATKGGTPADECRQAEHIATPASTHQYFIAPPSVRCF
jgi:hypothetical protein